MLISYSLDNELIFEKEIKKKDVLKVACKIAFITVGIISITSLTVYAATPFYKKKIVDAGTFWIIERILETVKADKVIESVEYFQDLPIKVIKGLLDLGYTVEEILEWIIENR